MHTFRCHCTVYTAVLWWGTCRLCPLPHLALWLHPPLTPNTHLQEFSLEMCSDDDADAADDKRTKMNRITQLLLLLRLRLWNAGDGIMQIRRSGTVHISEARITDSFHVEYTMGCSDVIRLSLKSRRHVVRILKVSNECCSLSRMKTVPAFLTTTK